MEPIHIFLAEDSEADIFLVTRALEEMGFAFTLQIAHDGDEALKFVASIGTERNCPDIALVDLNLPRQDGEQVLKGFRERADCLKMPIIITTSSEVLRDRALAERYKAVFFSKPSDLNEFFRIGTLVKSLCNLN